MFKNPEYLVPFPNSMNRTNPSFASQSTDTYPQPEILPIKVDTYPSLYDLSQPANAQRFYHYYYPPYEYHGITFNISMYQFMEGVTPTSYQLTIEYSNQFPHFLNPLYLPSNFTLDPTEGKIKFESKFYDGTKPAINSQEFQALLAGLPGILRHNLYGSWHTPVDQEDIEEGDVDMDSFIDDQLTAQMSDWKPFNPQSRNIPVHFMN